MRLREHLWLGYLSKYHIKITSLENRDDFQKRSEAWDIISEHGYENCVQQVCPRLLYKAWECIENGVGKYWDGVFAKK